jgi:hypothetical protein
MGRSRKKGYRLAGGVPNVGEAVDVGAGLGETVYLMTGMTTVNEAAHGPAISTVAIIL